MAPIHIKFSSNARSGLLSKGPVVAVIFLAVLIWLAAVGYNFVKLSHDHYFSYEGQVLRIERRWSDFVAFGFREWEHLSIQTPDGRRIDRLISAMNRLMSGIEEGDWVIKERGFSRRVRPRDKLTSEEILQRYRK